MIWSIANFFDTKLAVSFSFMLTQIWSISCNNNCSYYQVLKLLKDFNSEFVTKKFDNSEETKIIANKEEKGILETYYKV